MQTSKLAGKRVLVVEDEQFTRTMVAQLVRTLKPEEVITANNGLMALDEIRKQFKEVDLIISDFRMPKMNGIELLKAIRSQKTAAPWNTRFAMLTGFADANLVGLAMALHVSAFMSKPLSRTTLETRIDRMDTQPSELLQPEEYEKIDISAVTQRPKTPDQSEEEFKRKQAAVVLKKRRDALLRKAVLAKSVRSDAPAKSAAKPASKKWDGPEMNVPINKLRSDHILSRDVLMGGNQLLVSAGTRVSKRLLFRLIELGEIDPTLKSVWVRG